MRQRNPDTLPALAHMNIGWLNHRMITGLPSRIDQGSNWVPPVQIALSALKALRRACTTPHNDVADLRICSTASRFAKHCSDSEPLASLRGAHRMAWLSGRADGLSTGKAAAADV